MSLLSFPSGQGRRKEKSPSELALARQQGSSGQGKGGHYHSGKTTE